MSRPFFSIITAALNSARVIEETLASAAEQTFRDFEYIVVDGGSTDGTPQISAQYWDVVSQIVPGPDRGVYDAMNKGLARAAGEVVYFLNAGDRLHDSQVLERVAEEFRSPHRPDLVYGDLVDVYPSGRHVRLHYPNLSSRFLYRRTVCHQAIFARREVFGRTGPFDTRWRFCADFDWLMKALYRSRARVGRLPQPIALYLKGGMSDRMYVMKERFRIMLEQMPRPTFLALGLIDAASRLFYPNKKISQWVRMFLGDKPATR